MRGIRISRLKLGVLALAILAMGTFVSPASAAVVGHLSLTNCPSGGVIVSAGAIDWTLPIDLGTGCIATGIGTTANSVLLGPIPVVGTINDLTFGVGNIGFITIGAYVFDLAVPGLGPGSGVSCASNPGEGLSCSVPGSPFVLTQSGTGTAISLRAQGTIFDPSDSITSFWDGVFTTQLNNTLPADIQGTIISGGSISSTYSGEFDVTSVPEPITMLLIGTGLIVFALVRRHKKARA